MRIRTVKPEWLENERLAACSDAARVLSVGLILMADDHGRGRATTAHLAATVWTYVDKPRAEVDVALAELVKIGFVVVYKDNGQTYFEIPGWGRHQRISHRTAPRIPAISDESLIVSTTPPETLRNVSGARCNSSGDIPEADVIPPEVLRPDLRKGKGIKGRGKGKGVAPDEPAPTSFEALIWFHEWREHFKPTEKLTMTSSRRSCIEQAIARHGLEDCLKALRGYAADPWRHEQIGRHDVSVLLGPGGTTKEDKVIIGVAMHDKGERDGTLQLPDYKDPGEDELANAKLMLQWVDVDMRKAGQTSGTDSRYPFTNSWWLRMDCRIPNEINHAVHLGSTFEDALNETCRKLRNWIASAEKRAQQQTLEAN